MSNYNTRPAITSPSSTRQDISASLWSISNFPWQETFYPWQWVYPKSYNTRPVVTDNYTTRPII